MKILTTIAEVRAEARRKPRVLVPTMGALHNAHGELIRVAREAARKNGEVAVSIFVNPLQFEPGSDYERYPRPEKADEEFCRNAGADLLFRPSAEEVYPKDRSIFVEEISLSSTLEGKSRPGHFRGVCTVVAKLFNILAPDAAVFGEKDFQQLAIVRRMVRDLDFAVEIASVPIVREPDGLALSSRNAYLSPDQRRAALSLSTGLTAAERAFAGGELVAGRTVQVSSGSNTVRLAGAPGATGPPCRPAIPAIAAGFHDSAPTTSATGMSRWARATPSAV